LQRIFKIKETESAAFDVPFFLFGDPADAWPAVLFHGSHVLHAFDVGWEVFSLVFSSLLAVWVGLVDIVNAQDLQVVGAFVGGGESNEGSEGNKQLHYCIL
jgi:hypothetical protein